MARTALFTHPACIAHDPGQGHPERPDRLRAILRKLEEPAFAALDRREAPLATRDDLSLVHSPRLVDALLEAVPKSGRVAIDADTIMSPGSGEAALRAAGAVLAAVDAVIGGEADSAFCAVRPPGHHAEPERPMGFCLFNNVAIGAGRHPRLRRASRQRHSGGGRARCRAVLRLQPSMAALSGHRRCQRDRGGQRGQPAAARHGRRAPELMMISAGFDAHRNDPLGGLQLVEADYAWITGEFARIAEAHAKGRIVSTLEGGYDLDALANSVAAHVGALMAA
jgi:acetoin utilization deacetylase AcuC-like enzyme